MKIALLTPTFARDLERFRMLRASLEAFGWDIPHYAVVQTEDLPAFRAAALPSRSLHLLPTSEFLAPEVEAQRVRLARMPRALWKFQRSLNKRLGLFPAFGCEGWNTQQLVKLGAAEKLGVDVLVSMDSDVLVTSPLRPDLFHRGDAIALYSRPTKADSEHAHWRQRARGRLGLDPHAGPHFHYLAHPFVFSREVLRGLHARLESHNGMPWWQALTTMRITHLSEFELYGAYAREIHGMRNLYETRPRTRWLIKAEERVESEKVIRAAVRDPLIDFLVVQASHRWPIEPLVATITDELRSARGELASA
ncbi:MAG TPA: DUF6492 family protein [Verrucomicrobiae bacterium]|nr:DUF6492 family protein [Verrucomicrobiae bacterium]